MSAVIEACAALHDFILPILTAHAEEAEGGALDLTLLHPASQTHPLVHELARALVLCAEIERAEGNAGQ